MTIDFSLPSSVENVRDRVRSFLAAEVLPWETRLRQEGAERSAWKEAIVTLRRRAQEEGLWLPHMPQEWGGMGLGPTALAVVSCEAGRSRLGPSVLNCQAPDEGNMHTLLHFGTESQRDQYLAPLCEGRARSCFAMTEPEVSGSDPTLIRTRATWNERSKRWTLNGHKWFISGAKGANFAIVIAKSDEEGEEEGSRGLTTAFLVDLPQDGWMIVRDIATMAGVHNHCEIRIDSLELGEHQVLGERGGGHRLGQRRLGPARLAHCMRWIGQAELALEMLVSRATERRTHGSLLSEKQGIQWMISESMLELYQAKLMVLHAAYLIETGKEFRTEVAMCKVHVARSLGRIADRAVQVHGALGYSRDTPLADLYTHSRWARIADGADEVHLTTIAERTIAQFGVNADLFPEGSLPL